MASGSRLVKLPKSDTGRRDIPLEPDLARRLWRLQREPDELLFTAPQGGRMNYGNTYSRVLTPTLEAASAKLGEDVTWAAWHTFRHTVASRLFAAGRNVKQVQEWLGHHKAELHAGHLRPPHERRRWRAAGAALGGKRGANNHPETGRNGRNGYRRKCLEIPRNRETRLSARPQS